MKYLIIFTMLFFIFSFVHCGGGGENFVCQESAGCDCECNDLGNGTSQICEVCCPVFAFFGCPVEGCEPVVNSPCPLPPPEIVSTPDLLTPIDNTVIEQNNANIGCPNDPTSGFGFEIFFDWTDSSSPNGIIGYHILAQSAITTLEGEIEPIVAFVETSEFTEVNCNAFVADSNLNGWEWRVTAKDNLGNFSKDSETGLFQFEPCRLEDGTLCVDLP